METIAFTLTLGRTTATCRFCTKPQQKKLEFGCWKETVSIFLCTALFTTRSPSPPCAQVFLRAGQRAILDKLRMETMRRAAVTIQRIARGKLTRIQYAKQRAAVIRLQAAARTMFARAQLRQLRCNRAALVVQCCWRRYVARSAYRRMQQATVVIQASYRAAQARKMFKQYRKHQAALQLQKCWRGHTARRDFGQLREAAMALQSAYRVKVAKDLLRRFRQEAREVRRAHKFTHGRELFGCCLLNWLLTHRSGTTPLYALAIRILLGK